MICRAAGLFILNVQVFLALSESLVSHWVEQAFRPAVKAPEESGFSR